jgi:hypothetical protein
MRVLCHDASTAAAGSEKADAGDAVHFLLHALKQPLTALQCMLELSSSGSHSQERYLSTVAEALDLTARMRLLVEALQQLANMRESAITAQKADFPLGILIRDSLADLLPVAESRGIRVRVLGDVGRMVSADRGLLARALFQLLESVISSAQEGSDLKLLGVPEDGALCLILSWTPINSAEHASPSCRQEVGLLVAQHAFESAGAICNRHNRCTYRICLPVAGVADNQQEVQP